MASQFGVNVVTSVNAARPIRVQSNTPIGAVGTIVLPADITELKEEEIVIYNAIKNGELISFANSGKMKNFCGKFGGSLSEVADAIDDQNVACQIVVKAIEIAEAALDNVAKAEDFYLHPIVKSRIIEGIDGLRNSRAILGYKPNLLIAPRFSHDPDVAAQLVATAERLWATAFIDLNAASEAGAITAAGDFGTKRAILCDPYCKVWNTETNVAEFAPSSARLAALQAWTDGQWEYGFADSFSNREIKGISGTSRAIEFEAGIDCEADRLRAASVATIIRCGGYRAWGADTTDIDPIWRDLPRVRTFDRICEAALDGLFWAIDRRASDTLKAVKDSVEQLLLALKGSNVVLGFEVTWDEEKNTKANITAGKFYLNAELQNMPIVKRLEVDFTYSDRWGDLLMNMANGGE
ncbi:MAG: phage tail sheath subtilisin-like domain-containing protein [Helicobacteraceae bacterium]|jgi:hypothetical protein|nr:phage tail sheath subtilisin-like domain-containing protein [Helicobacteraceae bacterium]